MSLKIRLSRVGAAHNPIYRVVVKETRSRRDGRYNEILGTYSPRSRTEPLRLNIERTEYWLSKGARFTETAASLYKKARKAAVVEA